MHHRDQERFGEKRTKREEKVQEQMNTEEEDWVDWMGKKEKIILQQYMPVAHGGLGFQQFILNGYIGINPHFCHFIKEMCKWDGIPVNEHLSGLHIIWAQGGSSCTWD